MKQIYTSGDIYSQNAEKLLSNSKFLKLSIWLEK